MEPTSPPWPPIQPSSPLHMVGVFSSTPRGPSVNALLRNRTQTFRIPSEKTMGARVGQVVQFLPKESTVDTLYAEAEITKILGSPEDAHLVSLIVLALNGVDWQFPQLVKKEAQKLHPPPSLKDREDLRSLPFVTVDGEDARDFDDAVFAEPDPSPDNPHGWHLIVAIADVAHYVKPGHPIDIEAYARGNSIYLPDRVVPMLPEELSNNLCSLRPNEDRPVLAVHLYIDPKGNLKSFRFVRALIHSAARLTYTEVQAFYDGHHEALPEAVRTSTYHLIGAYQTLLKARQARGTLDLSIPERKVVFDKKGKVAEILPRIQYPANQLIEEFMVAANVAAATFLSKNGRPCMYRIHPAPSMEKLTLLRHVLEPLHLNLPFGEPTQTDFTDLIDRVRDRPEQQMINEWILRSQGRASYSPQNIGHYGLNLDLYAHFTSPIRRYSDLLVHREITSLLDGSPSVLPEDMQAVGLHLSDRERLAMLIERESLERYLTLFLEDKVGSQFDSVISGIIAKGIFVELLENGANGFIPIGLLPPGHYRFNPDTLVLRGSSKSNTFRLGDSLRVELLEANALTHSLLFGLPGRRSSSKGRRSPSSKERRHTR